MGDAILAQDVYCANPNPKPKSQSGSWVHKILGTQNLRSTLEYDLATTIVIRSLTQLLTCEMGFIHFSVHDSTQSGEYNLSLLAHHPISQKDKQRNKILLVMVMLPVLVLVYIFH